MGSSADKLDSLVATARRWYRDDPLADCFMAEYHRDVPIDDVEDRDLGDVVSVAAAHLELGRRRAPGETVVKAILPATQTGDAGSAVLLFVTDDIPFLVDTVRMALDRRSLGIELLVLPMLSVVRNSRDELAEVIKRGAARPPGTQLEAWTQIRLNGCHADLLSDVEGEVTAAIADVVRIVTDFPEMRERLLSVSADNALVAWLANQHFVLLGAASYERRVDAVGEVSLHLAVGSEFGEYRPDTRLDATAVGPPSKAGDVNAEPVVIARTEALSTIHRSARLTSLAIRRTADDTVIEERFIGLLGSGAYRESVFAIPVLQDRATALVDLSGAAAISHTGRAIKNVVETLPRDVVFELGQHQLASLVIDIVGLHERSIVRVFDVAEPVGSFSTVFVYLPQSRFVAGLQNDVADLVAEHYGGDVRDVETLVSSSSLARISMTVHTSGPVNLDRLAETVDGATASWDDQARHALIDRAGAQRARDVLNLVGAGIEHDYRARVEPASAVDDLLRVASLIEQQDESVATSMSRSTDPATGSGDLRCSGATTLRRLPNSSHNLPTSGFTRSKSTRVSSSSSATTRCACMTSVFESFDVGWLWDGIGALPRSDRWQTQAHGSLRDDLMTVLADLTAHVIRTADGSPEAWIEANRSAYTRMIDMETEICRAESFDLTTLSVALRQLRNLTVKATR